MPRESDRDRIYADLRRRIEEGEFLDDDGRPLPLPTLKSLREHYGTSKAPVDNAVYRLKLEGLIVGVQGGRMWVAQPEE